MVGLYGSASRQLALLLFGSDPFTEKIERKKYELLLKQTNEAIIKNVGREDWKNKLTPFSGPQCNEDRGKKVLYEYNPDLRLKNVTYKIVAPASVDSPNNERTGNNVSIDNQSYLPVSNDNVIAVLNEAAFRYAINVPKREF